MNKKNLIFLINLLFIFLMIFVCSGCSLKKSSQEELSEKNVAEIRYLDEYILQLLNGINNIELKQYNAKLKRTDNLNEITKENADVSNENAENNTIQYSMSPNLILTSKNEINWENLKIQVEKLNSMWPSIIVDLYKADIDSAKLTEFGNLLNECVGYVKNENKKDTLNCLAKLYSYIPSFKEKVSNNLETEIAKTKSEVVYAYINIENEDWNLIKDRLTAANTEFEPVVNNTNSSEKEYNISKAYIMLQEFRSAIENKDKELLYIKYKNLMEELIIL